ncbi:DUF3302 domain-containing protein [Salinicola aestuarinus]|uniref:DUF3302 domain-containing protein n=1 Tax=Salinicola aestuarinus TaxID=1949082 RepID=UPI000DA1D75F|nr:DUF3302 domain-containing protein [Salinicola aestuarinus]
MLSYVALGLMVFVALVLFYGIIAVHDIPYLIAKGRDHPHQDAIHVAGWVSLFTLHVLWPFLWIWATLYRPERGWGFQKLQVAQQQEAVELQQLREELERMRARVDALESAAPTPGSREA